MLAAPRILTHLWLGQQRPDIRTLEQAHIGAKKAKELENSTVTAVAVYAPDQNDVDTVQGEFRALFPGVISIETAYPSTIDSDGNSPEVWDFVGHCVQPGQVSRQGS